jgi:hypothetical protein
MKRPGSARSDQPSASIAWPVLLGLVVGLTLPLILPLSHARAEEAPPAPDAQKTELYSASYDVTWDKLLATLKSFDLSVTAADKDSGKITTVPRRYFKISSAKFPPIQEDYRDTYEVQVTKRPENKTQVQITRKFEMYDRTRPPNGEWMVQQEIKEKTGTSVSEILAALALEIAAAALPSTR